MNEEHKSIFVNNPNAQPSEGASQPEVPAFDAQPAPQPMPEAQPAFDTQPAPQPMPEAASVAPAQPLPSATPAAASVEKPKKRINFKLFGIIVGVLVVIIILIVVFGKGGSGSASSGSSVLPSSSSKYDKICTVSDKYEEASIDMTFGIYEKDGKVAQDTVIVWYRKDGKIKIPKNSTEAEVVSGFALLTGMKYRFGGTSSNTNNYFKNGKVYITNTIEYSADEFSSVNELVEDYINSNNATCK